MLTQISTPPDKTELKNIYQVNSGQGQGVDAYMLDTGVNIEDPKVSTMVDILDVN